MRVLGLDCSSKSAAWAIINDGELEAYGEILFVEANFNKRLQNMRKKLEDSMHVFGEIDYIGFEKAVKVRSVTTVIVLAEAFGVIKSVLMELDAPLVEVTPLAWQSYIGNPNLAGEAKKEFLDSRPELKTTSQKQKAIREYRKNKTMDFVEDKTGVRMANDNLSDACSIGLYVYEKMKELNEET